MWRPPAAKKDARRAAVDSVPSKPRLRRGIGKSSRRQQICSPARSVFQNFRGHKATKPQSGPQRPTAASLQSLQSLKRPRVLQLHSSSQRKGLGQAVRPKQAQKAPQSYESHQTQVAPKHRPEHCWSHHVPRLTQMMELLCLHGARASPSGQAFSRPKMVFKDLGLGLGFWVWGVRLSPHNHNKGAVL